MKRMQRIATDHIRFICFIRVSILRFDKGSIKIYCTRVPFGSAQDKLPIQIHITSQLDTKNYFLLLLLIGLPYFCIMRSFLRTIKFTLLFLADFS